MDRAAAKELLHIDGWLEYDQINRELTWLTLSVDLPAWRKSFTPLVDQARAALDADTG